MVLQRWQTVLLFISIVLISIFSVSNYATLISSDGGQTVLSASSNTGYWIYNMVIILLLLISIFQFKNLTCQKILIWLSAAMMGGSAIWGYNYLHRLAAPQNMVHLNVSWVLLIVAFGFALISIILITRDQRILKSYDRIR